MGKPPHQARLCLRAGYRFGSRISAPKPTCTREKRIYTKLFGKDEFRLVVPASGATKADSIYRNDVIPLFLDPGTDLDVRFGGSDFLGMVRLRTNDVPTGLGTKLHNGTNLTETHRQQAANTNNYLVEFDA